MKRAPLSKKKTASNGSSFASQAAALARVCCLLVLCTFASQQLSRPSNRLRASRTRPECPRNRIELHLAADFSSTPRLHGSPLSLHTLKAAHSARSRCSAITERWRDQAVAGSQLKRRPKPRSHANCRAEEAIFFSSASGFYCLHGLESPEMV